MQNRLGANTGSYHRYSLPAALEGIAAAGYRYVELAAIPGVVEHVPLGADDRTLNGVVRQLNDFGLIPISLSAHSDLTTPAGQQDARRALNLCERLGIGIMNTAVGGPFNESEDEAAFLGGIHALADEAAARDVVIGIEIHGTLTGSGRLTRSLVEKVNDPAVRINYDTANSEYFTGVPVEVDLPDALPLVAHCHLKDKLGGAHVWDFPALGAGHVDFEKVIALFEHAGYTGPFSVEIEFKEGEEPALEIINQAMKQSREYASKLGLL
jgi:L-ribulose-5-phosphate 3-epimerase